MKMIKCEKLSKFYSGDNIPALKELSLEVEKNSVYGFLGPNGAGKTTCIKILTGLMKQSSGEAWVAGEKVNMKSLSLRKKIGYLGQEPKMYSWMKGQELLVFVGELFGLSKTEREKRAFEMLEMAGLKDAANKKISAYSGGMTQRLGIAQAMMGKPEVLFLDEPTSALDPIGRKEVLDFIASLKQTCTVFMSTHILTDVERVCDTVAIINKGEIITQEKTDVLKQKYSSKTVRIELSDLNQAKLLFELTENADFSEKVVIANNVVEIYPINPIIARREIFKIIYERGFDVEKFVTLNASLEDVFVKLIEDSHEL